MKRLCVFIYSMEGGGAQTLLIQLMKSFQAENVGIDLLLISPGGSLYEKIPGGVKVNLVNRFVFRFGWLGKFLATAIALRRIKPSYVLTVAEWPNLLAPLVCKAMLSDATVIISEHSTKTFVNSPESYGLGSWVAHLARKSYLLADKWIVSSEAIKAALNQVMPEYAGQVAVIPNPINIKDIHALAAGVALHPWLKEKVAPVLLAVGRLDQNKDYPTMLSAFSILKRKIAAKLIILGEGPLLSDLRELSKNLGIEDSVDFAGFQENPFPFYENADLFIHSSLFEGFGNVFIEAMACGLPVATTDCDTPREIFGSSDFSRITPIRDAEALAESAFELLSHHFEKDKIRISAKPYDIGLIAERYMANLDIRAQI